MALINCDFFSETTVIFQDQKVICFIWQTNLSTVIVQCLHYISVVEPKIFFTKITAALNLIRKP